MDFKKQVFIYSIFLDISCSSLPGLVSFALNFLYV